MNKPIEYWATLIGMILYVVMRDADKDSIYRRIVKTCASAFLAYGLSPSLAEWFNGSEYLAVIAVMSVGLITLDALTVVMSNSNFIKKLLMNWLGQDKQ
jgi:hypothetical protein